MVTESKTRDSAYGATDSREDRIFRNAVRLNPAFFRERRMRTCVIIALLAAHTINGKAFRNGTVLIQGN